MKSVIFANEKNVAVNVMAQYIIVSIILAAAVFYVVYRVWRELELKKRNVCGGGCTDCPFAKSLKDGNSGCLKRNAVKQKEDS